MSRALVIAILVTASAAHAQPDAPTRAHELFDRGRELMDKAAYDEACARFTESLALARAIGTELNLGECHEQLGHFAMAWHYFDDAARELAKASDPREAFARERADRLAPKLATIVVKIADPAASGLAVTIGGRAVEPAAAIEERVDPGMIAVRVASHHQKFEHVSRAVAGTTVVVEVPPLIAPAVEPEAEPAPRAHDRSKLAYALGASGGALAIGGLVVGLVARSRYQHEFDDGNCMHAGGAPICNQLGYTNQRSAIHLSNIGTIVGISGVALFVAGGIAFSGQF